MNRLYLDDLRDPPVGWTVYRPEQIDQFIHDCQFADQISFDHDLGDNQPTGAQVAERIFKIAIEDNWWTDKIPVFNVHSMNPVGRENIWRILDNLVKILQEPKNLHDF